MPPHAPRGARGGACSPHAQNSWFSPPNTSLTESSVKIAPDRVGQAAPRTAARGCSPGAPALTGIVSVTTISFRPDVREVLERVPEKMPCVAAAYTLLAPASLTVWAAADQRSGGVDHVVDDHRRLARDIADHVTNLRDLLGRALLVEDRQLGADLRREFLVQLDPARVRRHDHEVRQPEVVEVLGEHEQRGHVIDRFLEEPLDLAGVQVHRQHAIGARGLQHARHQARGDRLARARTSCPGASTRTTA